MGMVDALVMHAAGDGATHWPVAAGLLAVTSVASLVVARAGVPRIAGRSLRQRAATAGAVGAAVFLGEFRDARLAIRDASGGRARRRSLRLPVHRSLAVAWRDATALSRSLGSVAWTLPFLGVLALGLHAAVDQRQGRHTIIPIGFALIGGYIAALQLVEPARLDADDARRTRWSPYPAAALAQRHAVVPTVLLAVVGLVASLAGSRGSARGTRSWPLPLHVCSPRPCRDRLDQRLPGPCPLAADVQRPGHRLRSDRPGAGRGLVPLRPDCGARRRRDDAAPADRGRRHGLPPTVPVLQAIAIGAGWTSVILWWVGTRARRRRQSDL